MRESTLHSQVAEIHQSATLKLYAIPKGITEYVILKYYQSE